MKNEKQNKNETIPLFRVGLVFGRWVGSGSRVNSIPIIRIIKLKHKLNAVVILTQPHDYDGNALFSLLLPFTFFLNISLGIPELWQAGEQFVFIIYPYSIYSRGQKRKHFRPYPLKCAKLNSEIHGFRKEQRNDNMNYSIVFVLYLKDNNEKSSLFAIHQSLSLLIIFHHLRQHFICLQHEHIAQEQGCRLQSGKQ